jgi:WS/DGAT/MGAT family acyltransferase
MGMATSQRLSPLDASFLYYEKPQQRMHVGCVALLDGRLPFEPFVATMAERLGSIHRYRQRPVRPFLDLEWPHWEDDPQFDVRRHVRHVAVPHPGDDEAFHELVDALFATPLDPDRPLWETYLIDGLAGGRAALLCKIHHAMIDGVSGAQLLEVMADPPENGARPRKDGVGSAARTTNGGGGVRAALSPGALIGLAGEAFHAIRTIAALVREPGSTLPFNRPISDARRIVWTSFPLDDFLVARGAGDCKVNDVVLAIVSGALRRWLQGRGISADGMTVRTLVPVSVRGADEHMTLGNLVTAMVARLPVDVADPRERLRRMAAEMRALKDQGQARATGFAMQTAGWIPAPVHALLARLVSSTALLNTVTTNVPGPREACRLLGRRIDEVHPIVPLFDGMGIEFAIMSYADRMSICAVADPALVPDAADLSAHLRAASEELSAALSVPDRPAASAFMGPVVADVMSPSVVTLASSAPLATAWALMRQHKIRHLPVVAADGRLIGVVTHRDLLAASPSTLDRPGVLERIVLSASASVGDVMETHVSVAAADEPAALAGDRMLRHKIGCLPVVNADGGLAGIVTGDDFVRWATVHMRPAEPIRQSA